MTAVEHGTSGYQQVGSCFDNGGDRVMSHAAIHFDTEAEISLRAQFAEAANLVERERNKSLVRQSRGSRS